MVEHLALALDHAIDGDTAKSRNAFWPRANPPVHQIEVMAILVEQRAAGTSGVLNPVLRFFLERPAKFLAPNHSWLADFARLHKVVDSLEISGVTKFVADHDDAITFLNGAQKGFGLFA